MSNRKPDPACRSVLRWLLEPADHVPPSAIGASDQPDPRCHGKHALAPLTGQDARALAAFVHLVELYSCADRAGAEHAVRAMYHAAQAMQPTTRPLAQEVIAFVLNWDDRVTLWQRIGAAVSSLRDFVGDAS